MSLKRITVVLLLLSCFSRLTAQTPILDSLKNVLANTKEDTAKVKLLSLISFYTTSVQKATDIANEGLALAKKINYLAGEGQCLNQLGNASWYGNNFPQATYYYLQGLKIHEQMHDSGGMGASLSNIGFMHREQGDYKTAIDYYRKALLYKPKRSSMLAIIDLEFGDAFEQMNQNDSALVYYQRSFDLFSKIKDQYQFAITLSGLGDMENKMGNKEVALGYYHQAQQNAAAYKDTLSFGLVDYRVADFFHSYGINDSAIYYAKQSLFFSQKDNYREMEINSGKLLSQLYAGKDEQESNHYLQAALTAEDSLYSRQRTNTLQTMFLNESQRQEDMASRVAADERERKQNIQFALIAIGIITFIILFLMLSRSIIVTEKWISFFGVLGLLIVFEFINLVIHPKLASITHDSPWLMLLILVAIAAVLIPAHHRIEKWIKEKMTEKNKKIRLAAAKKTIEELEQK